MIEPWEEASTATSADESGPWTEVKAASVAPWEESSPTSTATTPPPSPVELQPESARNIPSITATTSGGPPLQLTDAKVALTGAVQEISEGFGDMLTHPSPIPTPFPEIGKDEHWAVAAGKEAVNLAVGVPQFFTTSLGIGAAAAGVVAPTAVAAVFTVDLLKSLGEQIHSTYKNWSTMTGAEKAVAVTDAVGTGIFARMTGKHTVKGAERFAESKVPKGQGIETPTTPLSQQQILDTAAKELAKNVKEGELVGGEGSLRLEVGRPATVIPPDLYTFAPITAEAVKETLPENVGGTLGVASVDLPAKAQAIEAANKAKQIKIFAEASGVPYVEGDTGAMIQAKIKAKAASVNAPNKEAGAAAGTPTGGTPAAVKPVELIPDAKKYPGGVVRVTYRDVQGNEIGYGQLDGKVINMVSVEEPYQKKGYGAQIIKDLRGRGGLYGVAGTQEGLALMRSKSVGAREYEPNKFTFEPATPDSSGGTPAAVKPAVAETETAGAIATPGAPLSPLPAGSASLPPKSQRQIITDIAKGLKLPVRFGRLTTTKFGGYFKSVENLIGSKRADDIPIVSHEAGHKLDKTFSLSADATLRTELDVLGDPATPGSRSSWTKSKTRKYKMGEGVAEFTRHWLTDPAHAQKVAPNTFAAFEKALDANKDFGDTMRQAQQDIALWRNADPQARLRSQISIGENPNKTRYTLSQLTRDLVDDLHILRLAVLDAAPRGSSLPPSLDPYLLARNLRGSYGMAATFIRDGVVDFKTKAVQLGTGLEDALKPVAGRLNDFRDWIVAKRAQELHSQGRESGLISSDIDAVAKKFDADADFQKAFQSMKEWNDALLQYAVDSGLIIKGTPRTQKEGPTGSYAIREMNQDYVPFHRVFEVGAGEAPSQQAGGIGAGLNVGKPGSLKGLKGSPRQIVDPFETMVKNAYTIITASEKAAINTAVADLSKLPDMGKWVERIAAPKERVEVELGKIREELEKTGVDLTGVPDDLLLSFFRQSRGTPFGENIIRVSRDGKAEFYRLNRDLHDTFKALDLEDSGKLVRILSAPAQLLRAGVVLEPSFNIANVLRDTFSAAVIGKYGALPFETTLRGMAAIMKDPKLVAEWAASGGKSAVEASYFDRAKLQKFLSDRIAKDLTPADRALIVARSPLSALRWLTSAFEEATRIGEYKIALEKLRKGGMPDGEARRLAAFESRDRQDFAKGGAKTKIVRHMAAFWNAGLQANVKLAQAFKERPVRTTLQGLAFITIPKLIEQAINWNDEDYWARKQWERDLFFLIPIGKDTSGHTRFLRLPTPFEVGIIFGTFPGRIMQGIREESPESMKSFPSLFLKQSVPNPVPQAYQVIFEDFLSGKKGWDVWRGRTIVPESLADEPPEMQWTEQTSGIAKKAGNALKFSPMKIDHLIERTTGGMGKLVTGRAVPGQRFITAPLSVSNQATEAFYDRLEAVREDAARAKAANKPMPANYAAFQSTERALSALRKRARETKDLDQKARLQEQMLKTTTEFLKRHPAL